MLPLTVLFPMIVKYVITNYHEEKDKFAVSNVILPFYLEQLVCRAIT